MDHLVKPFLLIVLLLCLSACTNKTMDLLKSRVGQMDFEEALQQFGPPTRCAEAGVTKACLWVYGSGGVMYAPVGRSFVPMPFDPPTLRLTFTNGYLSYWELKGNWD
jgi:hypothetical protein